MPTGARSQSGSAPVSVLAGMGNSVRRFGGSFGRLFHPRYKRSTVLMLAAWTAAIFVYHGLTVYIVEHSKTIERNAYDSSTVSGYLLECIVIISIDC